MNPSTVNITGILKDKCKTIDPMEYQWEKKLIDQIRNHLAPHTREKQISMMTKLEKLLMNLCLETI